MAPKARGLSVELLCIHHSLDEFSSGDPATDEIARHLYERTRQRDVDDMVTFVVAQSTGTVVGIASVVDLILMSDLSAEGEPVEGRCLFYSLLAVDRRFQSGLVLSMLLDELERIRDRRFSRGAYLGEVAAPLAAAGSRAVSEFLERREFLPLQSDAWLWFRARTRE
jgi:hypothetical protein